MEASERPQPPLDHDDGASVRALDDRLVIERLTVTDERAAQLVRDRQAAGQDPGKTVAASIEIGARVLDREEAAAEVDFVRRELERAVAEHRRESERQQREAVERIETEIRRAFGDGEAAGLLAEALDEHQRELGELVEANFGEGSDEAVPRRIQAMIEQRNREFLERLSADDELNPLRPLVKNFSSWVRERKEAQDERDGKLEQKLDEFLGRAAELVGLDRARAAIEEAEEAGTRKGRTFEDRVFASIEAIALGRDDVAHHVGDEAAAGGGKRGDVVVELDAASGAATGRIVFEIKDERLGKREAWGVLNEAMDQRQAQFAVLVVAGSEKVPAHSRQLHQYEGNKLVVAVDRDAPGAIELEAAYCLARALMRARRDASLEVDAAGVIDAAEAIGTELARKQGMKRTLTGISKSASSVSDSLDEMDAAIRGQIEAIESLVARAAEGPSADLGLRSAEAPRDAS